MSGFDPIVPDPEWGRPSPSIQDDDVYEFDDDEDEDWEDDQCFECGQVGDECVCE